MGRRIHCAMGLAASGQEYRHLRCAFCASYGTGSTLSARIVGHRAIA